MRREGLAFLQREIFFPRGSAAMSPDLHCYMSCCRVAEARSLALTRVVSCRVGFVLEREAKHRNFKKTDIE